MVNRLSPEEAMFYFLDGSGTTTHLGALLILEPDADRTLDYASLVSLVENRLQLMPRYRQVVEEVSLGLARPLWVDDRDFDVTFHVRLSALPQPGTTDQLQEFIARILSRPLDRDRPLWELYLIEGLADGRLALLTKTHRCLLGNGDHPEISEVITDVEPDTEPLKDDLWLPARRPGPGETTLNAITDAMTRPGELAETVFRGGGPIADILSLADRSARFLGKTVQQAVNTAPDSPLNSSATSARLVTFAHVPRDGCQTIAERYECTFNDVVLGIITGVLRRWMLSVTDSVGHDTTVRAVLPLGARDAVVDGASGWFSEGRAEFITDLPLGEDAPTVRLMQVAGLADRYSQAQRRLAPGVRPPFGELGVVPFADRSARAFNSLFHRSYNVPISMSESLIDRRYVRGVPVGGLYTLPPLIAQRAMAISVNEYVDQVEFGFLADRNVVSDLPAMAGYVNESYEELLTGNTPLPRGAGEGI
ncbi:MAG: wax ester/triacylglycerol synthase family O-acyltransferase [Gordonia sp. (in: high G+C Gram-positive bacteria)]|uniref:wax ester/triacylglycerol synthase domain-containing protein n=1 Tax=Gordonia sp. (in: high G+C Gram-positive bacteria) TaxID=84139 RepID=UPI0039E43781